MANCDRSHKRYQATLDAIARSMGYTDHAEAKAYAKANGGTTGRKADFCPGCFKPLGQCEARAECYEVALGSPSSYR